MKDKLQNNKNTIVLRISCLLQILFMVGISTMFAQNSSSSGNTYIHENGELDIYGEHTFSVGNGVHPGIIGTERAGNKGLLSFASGSSWIGATSTAHTDGYVKNYSITPFVFPVGDNGIYRPVAVDGSPNSIAAYYGVDPTSAITSRIDGTNFGILPGGTGYNTARRNIDLNSVSSSEYWDIDGASNTRITISWDANSDISTLTNGYLPYLTIVGWDGLQWVTIPSTIGSPLTSNGSTPAYSGTSTFLSGTITTDVAIVPDAYSVYTLGGLQFATDFGDFTSFPNTVARYIDNDQDGTPDVAGSVWLGTSVSHEITTMANGTASGDIYDDGFTTPLGQLDSTIANIHTISLSAIGTATVHYSLEIDWDNNGTIDDTYTGSQTITGSGTATVGVNTPPNFTGSIVNYRVKVASSLIDLSSADFVNGEIEDYQMNYNLPLPVEILDINAKWSENDAIVTWSTATEFNNKSFDIERSFDGKHYEYAGSQLSHSQNGYSNEILNYSFLDQGVKHLTQKEIYYRLVQHDLDLNQKVYGPVSLKKDKDGIDESIKLYPIPTRESVTIYANQISRGSNYALQILDQQGRLVESFEFTATDNYLSKTINIQDYANGVYWVNLITENSSFKMQKLIKVD